MHLHSQEEISSRLDTQHLDTSLRFNSFKGTPLNSWKSGAVLFRQRLIQVETCSGQHPLTGLQLLFHLLCRFCQVPSRPRRREDRFYNINRPHDFTGGTKSLKLPFCCCYSPSILTVSHFSIWDKFGKLPVSYIIWLRRVFIICSFSAYFPHQWAMLLLDLQAFYKPVGFTGTERITHNTNTGWSKQTIDWEVQILANQSINSSLGNRSGKYGSCKGSNHPIVKESKPKTLALDHLISAFSTGQ